MRFIYRSCTCANHNLAKYSLDNLSANSTSWWTAGYLTSPRTTHPWTCFGNERVPTFWSPNLFFNIYTFYPPYFILAGSLEAGQKNAGHRTLSINSF
jgi:hypothetical protein